MKHRRPFIKYFRWLLVYICSFFFFLQSYSINDPVQTSALLGSRDSVKAGYSSVVFDFELWRRSVDNSLLPAIDSSKENLNLLNRISVGIEEDSRYLIQSDFTVTVILTVKKYNRSFALAEEFDSSFTINYSAAVGSKYNSLQYMVLKDSYKTEVKIKSIDTHGLTGWDASRVLRIDNILEVSRDYVFSCSKAIPGLSLYEDNTSGELTAAWGPANAGEDEFDLEWAWIEEGALQNYMDGASFNPKRIFNSNATRVTVSSAYSYNIPLLYEGKGRIYVRIRPVQSGNEGSRKEGAWTGFDQSSLVYFAYNGHETELNWQSSTTYAEQGKRKSVVQYYDGTLRNRQSVTKDNTTNTTVVAETFYDHQGRTVIQVLPSPTLSSAIAYTKNFNKGINFSGYPKEAYDMLSVSESACGSGAAAMETSTGTSLYYSAQNPLAGAWPGNINNFIPDAAGYPFTETRYGPDGRVALQSGVGETFKIGGGHETGYLYESVAQEDLDALFGTDAGLASHYFKNIVKDPNGQYSISYVDMYGRTIATALAGDAPQNVTPLESRSSKFHTRQLIDDETNRVSGNSIISSKTISVLKDGLHTFKYELNPEQLKLLDCNSNQLCYDCLYDLKITITSECGGPGFPYTVTERNFSLNNDFSAAASCNTGGLAAMAFSKTFSLMLPEGVYHITKVLSLSSDARNGYRDNVHVKYDTCKKFSQFYTAEYAALLAGSECNLSCASCDSIVGHSFEDFKTRFISNAGLQEPLTEREINGIKEAYNIARENCDRVCEENGAVDGMETVRSAESWMLRDMMPPSGQYANISSPNSRYNIFYAGIPAFPISAPYTPPYKNPVNYEWGATPVFTPYSSYRDAQGNNVAAVISDPSSFSGSFQASFARQLLYYHPEFKKLKAMKEKLPATYRFEADIKRLETWSSMVNATPGLPGDYIANILDYDPFFALSVSGPPSPGLPYRQEMKDKLESYINLSTNPADPLPPGCTQAVTAGYISLWQLVQSTVFCRSLSKAGCENSPQVQCILNTPAYPDAAPQTGCEADWDMVWQAFRSIYLFERNKLISRFLNEEWNISSPLPFRNISNAKLINAGFTPRIADFTDLSSSLSMLPENSETGAFFQDLAEGNANVETTGNDLMQAQFHATCLSYANVWIAQLSECGLLAQRWEDPALRDEDHTWLTERLVDICEKGSDINHPFGSSSINPQLPVNTEFGFRDFPEVIRTFLVDRCSFDISETCHPYLITAPKPYDRQQLMVNQVIATKPSECQCGEINKLEDTYRNSGYTGNFSSFIFDNYQTAIRQGTLDTLIALCHGTYTCNFLKEPISLPPLLQCRGLGGTPVNKLCINCNEYEQIKISFNDAFGMEGPIRTPQSATDTALNIAFENFANSLTGFSKHWTDYITFEDECSSSFSADCSSLDSILNMFYLSPAYISGPTGDSCKTAFCTFFNTAFSVSFSYKKWMEIFEQSCNTFPDPCTFRLSCSNLKELINDFYTLYGFTIYTNPNAKELLEAYISSRTGLNLTYQQIEDNYTHLCQSDCGLDITSFPNCHLLTMVYNSFISSNNGNPWTLPDCKSAFIDYLNDALSMDPEWTSTQVEAAYQSCRPGPSEQDNCAPAFGNICNPEISCNSLEYIVRLFHDHYGSNIPENCRDTFVLFFNSMLHTSYYWQDITDLYHLHCGAEPQICSDTAIDCKALMEIALNFVPQNPDSCKSEFLLYFNTFFNTSYTTFPQLAQLYWSHCNHILALCDDDYPEMSCTNLARVLNDFRTLFPDPESQLAGQCKSVFTTYFILRFGLTYEPQFSYLMGVYDLCGIKLDICQYDYQQKQAFVNDFNERFTSLNLPLLARKQLFTFLYNEKFINKKSVYHQKQPLQVSEGNAVSRSAKGRDPYTVSISVSFEDIAASMPQNLTEIILNATPNPSLENRSVLLGMKQAYFIMRPYGPGPDCKNDFVSWFNITMSSTFNFETLSKLYDRVCGNGSGIICPTSPQDQKKELLTGEPYEPYTEAYTPPGPLLCGLNEPIFTGAPITESNCSNLPDIAFSMAEIKYNLYLDSIKNVFDTAYYNKCMNAKDLESFTVSDSLREYHYTLYYYDQAGNLVRTVPPAGVSRNDNTAFLNDVKLSRQTSGSAVTPDHTLATEYRYNTLNQVVEQRTPDAGKSNFWYDRLGRLVASSNAKQAPENDYSYTLYDELGRIKEVGQLKNSTPLSSGISRNAEDKDIIGSLAWWLSNKPAVQITKTFYDKSYIDGNATLCPEYLCQQNLRNRVSYTAYYDSGVPGYAESHTAATYYSYDIAGNVHTLLQDYGNSLDNPNAMNTTGNRFKKIAYSYDLISVKVNQVAYQPGEPDAFYHRYSYDAENRLTDVETSFDKVIWEKDARYSYYKHGPLARAIIGQNQVQGIDYAYTLQGWLKGINSTSIDDGSFDMGADGKAGSFNSNIARDAYGISLNYFNGDYTPVGSTALNTFIANAFNLTNADANTTANALYNGNIAAQVVNIPTLGDALIYSYSYDQLNRLLAMDAYTGLSSTTNVFTPAITTNYKERLTYDANGNIQTYLRNNETGAAKNNYSYTYATGTNRLSSITNNVNAQTKSYAYDNIGNTTGDGMQGITNAVWNVYGKLQSVTNKDDVNISYTYSADGQRISKKVGSTEEWYVRDASGNVMLTYTKDAAINSGIISTKEYYKYGSSLLSIKNHIIKVDGHAANEGIITQVRGEDNYILTDANGNTKLTVRDTRTPVEDPANPGQVLYYLANVSTATLHSTYGANAKTYNGGFSSANFNGQRKSKEIGKDAQTALFWEYNGDVGRRWNVDPVFLASESHYLVLGGNPVIYIDPLGDFKTRFGAWLNKTFKGGDKIGKNKLGEWYVSKKIIYKDGAKGNGQDLLDEVKVGVERFYGKGRHAWSSEAEKMVEEERIKQDIYFKGEKSIYQIYETENEARNATLSWAVGLILPNYIKGATGAANASKSVGAAEGVENLAIRSDIVIKGGRSGQLLKNATGPTNSVVKGGAEGRVLITNQKGQVIWDITKERAKSVTPGQGFGPKVAPTQEQLNLIKQIWGN